MNKLTGGRGGVIVNTASMAGTRMQRNMLSFKIKGEDISWGASYLHFVLSFNWTVSLIFSNMTNSINAVQRKFNPLIFQNGWFNSTTHRSGPAAQLSSLYSHQTWGGGLHSGHVGEGLQGSFFWVNSICWPSVIVCSFTPCVCFLPSSLPRL